MDIDLLYSTVLPTLARSGVAFIGISTLADPFNFWSQMMELKDDDGRPVFKTIRYSLVCEACAKAGLEDTCKHNYGDLPYWQDETQHNKLEKIMKDKCDTFLTETKGYQSDPNIRPAFEPKLVQSWINLPVVNEVRPRNCFFVSVDPCAGGDLSEYAIVSCAFTNRGDAVILGAETLAYKTAIPQWSLLINHITAIRCIPGMESAYAVVAVESNLANEATHHQFHIANQRLTNVVVMNEDTHDRPGMRTYNSSKRTMWIQLNTYMSEGRVRFYHNFISVNGKRSPSEVKQELINQVANFKRIIEPSTKLGREPVERLTGKMGGMRDDLVIGLMQSIMAKCLFYVSPQKYGEYYDQDCVL